MYPPVTLAVQVGYRLVGTKGANIVPVARDTGAIIIIIPVRGPPREVRVHVCCVRFVTLVLDYIPQRRAPCADDIRVCV
jgi:hypothetical protein